VTRSDLELSPDQRSALDFITSWWRDSRSPYLRFGGYAGTGKTTIITQLERALPRVRIHYCAFAGKAVQVLRTKLTQEGVRTTEHTTIRGVPLERDLVTTIHGLIYMPIELETCGCGSCMPQKLSPGICPRPVLGRNGRPLIDVVYDRKTLRQSIDLIVVDEASMLGQEIWGDLLDTGVRILAVGDHGQLPPVGGYFNLMDELDVRLEVIHRQAENDPIIYVSRVIRETGYLPVGQYGSNVVKVLQLPKLTMRPDTLVICGKNETRVHLNRGLRTAHGVLSPQPTSGDRVICLRNHRGFRIFNGMRGTVLDLKPYDDARVAEMTIQLDDVKNAFRGSVWLPQFNEPKTTNERVDGTLWDFAYAITCHKAQGSEADDVVVFEERFGRPEDYRRWLYTAVTRAKKTLVVIGG